MYYGPFYDALWHSAQGVCIQEVATGKVRVVCRACYHREYHLDEAMTFAAPGRPGKVFEKHSAVQDGGICQDCGKEF